MKLSDLNIYSIGNTIQMVGAIYQGEDKTFLAPFPDEPLDYPLCPTLLDMDHEDWKKFLHQADLLEVEAKTEPVQGISSRGEASLAKVILRKSQRTIEQATSWRVYRRDKYTCRYCGRNDVPLTVDHLVLWEAGGPSIDDNLVACCRKDNKTRGDMEYAEWLQSDYYKKVSKSLPEAVKAANLKLQDTLDKIPRRVQPRSR